MMEHQAETPAWLKEEGNNAQNYSTNASGPPPGAPKGYAPVSSTETPQPTEQIPFVQSSAAFLMRNRKTFHYVMKLITICISILMIMTAFLSFGYLSGWDALNQILVAIYMLMFGSLLLLFELVDFHFHPWLSARIQWADHMFRRNFGFLYGTMGKAFFLIFIAFLSFGLSSPPTLSFVTGLLFLSFGSFQLALYLKYPELFESEITLQMQQQQQQFLMGQQQQQQQYGYYPQPNSPLSPLSHLSHPHPPLPPPSSSSSSPLYAQSVNL